MVQTNTDMRGYSNGFLAPAAPYIVGGTALQYQQQGAIGKYQSSCFNRKAAVAEQEAEAIRKSINFRFAKI